MATLDATTQAEYAALYNASDRAAAVVAAIASPVTVNIYDDTDAVVGTGTMSSPWATASGSTITINDVTGFAVTGAGTPDASWYLKFVSGTRYVKLSFGLSGSGKEAVWSRSDWTVGTKAGIRNSTITVAGNVAPVFTVTHATQSLPATGGTIQFTATDANGDVITYSLPTTRDGISIRDEHKHTGLVTVTSAAAGTSGNIVVRASDGILSTDAPPCAVTVAASSSASTARKWNPGHYVKTDGVPHQTDQTAYLDVALAGSAKALDAVAGASLKGSIINIVWGAWNTSGTTYSTAVMDRILSWHSTNGKKLIVELRWKSFNSSDQGVLFPSDLPAADRWDYGTGHVAAIWRASVMDKFIAACQWLATKYDAHPALEMICLTESTLGFTDAPAQPPDFSRSALAAQYKRLYSALSEAFTKTVVCANVNSLSGEVVGLLNDGYAKKLGHCTPDAFDSVGNMLFRDDPAGAGGENGTIDYRELRANHQIASAPVLGGKDDNGPATNVINWAQTNKVTHLSWVTTATTAGNAWAAIKLAITADPLLWTTIPPMYEYDGVKASTFNNAAVTTFAYNADATNWSALENAAFKSKLRVVNTPVRSTNSNRAISVFVDQDDPEAIAKGASGLERAENRWANPSVIPVTKTTVNTTPDIWVGSADIWFGWSTYIPSTWKRLFRADTGAEVPPIIQQWHHVSDPEAAAEPDPEGNPWATIALYCNGAATTAAWQVLARRNNVWPATDGHTYQYPTTRPTLKTDEWTDWIVKVRHHPETGYFVAWKKDSSTGGTFIKVFDTGANGCGFSSKGRNTPSGRVATMHCKSGIYVPIWDNGVQTKDAYPTGNRISTVQIYHAQYRAYHGNLASDALGIEYVRPR